MRRPSPTQAHRLFLLLLRGGLVSFALLFAFTGAFAAPIPPPVDGTGFLAQGEYVYEDRENGLWLYMSPTLKIRIERHEDKAKKLTWLEAEIWAKEPEVFDLIAQNPEKPFKDTAHMDAIARRNGSVFAMTSDFAHFRVKQGTAPGILIRDGVILTEKTRSKKSTAFPNLDTLALFADGDMRVYEFDELSAQAYLDMGAVDVLSFGPVLVRDGQINEEDTSRYGRGRDPRTGIGMFEKGHYLAVMAEGRRNETKGMNIAMLAQLFLDRGCSLAFNLDGGQSACMVFMGTQISHSGKTQSLTAKARTIAEIFAIGKSDTVLAMQ